MALFIGQNSFKGIQNFSSIDGYLHSQIKFDRNEWQVTLHSNLERDVEISYLFQFDRENNTDYYEIFYNGFDENILKYDILNLISQDNKNFKFFFE